MPKFDGSEKIIPTPFDLHEAAVRTHHVHTKAEGYKAVEYKHQEYPKMVLRDPTEPEIESRKRALPIGLWMQPTSVHYPKTEDAYDDYLHEKVEVTVHNEKEEHEGTAKVGKTAQGHIIPDGPGNDLANRPRSAVESPDAINSPADHVPVVDQGPVVGVTTDGSRKVAVSDTTGDTIPNKPAVQEPARTQSSAETFPKIDTDGDVEVS